MADKITIWDNQRTTDLGISSPVAIANYDFVTLFASGVSGVGQVEAQIAPDATNFGRSAVSGLNIADTVGHAIDIPEHGANFRVKCDTSGNYYVWLYAGTYTYTFTS